MLGRQHLMLSLATTTVLLTPYIHEYQDLSLLFLIGAGIGSLIPDVDATDASVFHRHIKGLNTEPGKAVNSLIGPILPLFGYSTKYLIYKPLVHVFNLVSSEYTFEEKHRSFSHSFLGVFTMTTATGLYLTALMIYTGFFSFLYLSVFLGGYMLGAFLHMLQDSCTKTGIAWNTPFSDTHLKGRLRTGKDNRTPRIMFYTLGTLLLGSLYAATHYSTEKTQITTFAATGLLWTLFMAFNSVRLEK